MNAVPFIDFPSLTDLEKYKDKIPSYDRMISVIQSESRAGNIVVHIGDAGCMPSEAIVVVDFAYAPTQVYEDIRDGKIGTNEYKYIVTGDNKGGLELTFGEWRFRMKEELVEQMEKRLEEYKK